MRKKATPATSRPTHGGHLSGPTEASTARKRSPKPAAKPNPPVAPTLTLPSECVVAAATGFKDSLAPLLEEPLTVTLDITSLQRIDTAGLQVLTAFVRERANQGRSVDWKGTSPALTTAAQLLGLTSSLRLTA